jgi:hypothetical protein
MLGEAGYAVTAAARRPDKLADAVRELRDAGVEAEEVAIVFQRPGEAL